MEENTKYSYDNCSGSLPEDYVINKIYNEIIQEMKEEKGIELTLDEVKAFINSQFQAVKFGINNCQSVKCPGLGAFLIKKNLKLRYLKETREETKEVLKKRYERTVKIKQEFKFNLKW